ncbi:hypothetical protein KAI46_13060, partial [bacterium]|nr:hypothetical protein [bacterium]
MRRSSEIMAIIFLLICGSVSTTVADSVTISPGSGEAITFVNECCPTFSWAAVEGAGGYELVIFTVQGSEKIMTDTLYDELVQVSEPTLTTQIPAPALSWTPAKEQGFIPGQTYAWCVRGLSQEDSGEWSSAAFFKVPETVVDDLESAIDAAVTDFLTEDEENLTFWSALEKRIDEIVTTKIGEETTSISAATTISEYFPRTGSEIDGNENVWYGCEAAAALAIGASGVEVYNVFIGYRAGYSTVCQYPSTNCA